MNIFRHEDTFMRYSKNKIYEISESNAEEMVPMVFQNIMTTEGRKYCFCNLKICTNGRSLGAMIYHQKEDLRKLKVSIKRNLLPTDNNCIVGWVLHFDPKISPGIIQEELADRLKIRIPFTLTKKKLILEKQPKKMKK